MFLGWYPYGLDLSLSSFKHSHIVRTGFRKQPVEWVRAMILAAVWTGGALDASSL
jgi:hypothetical protein